LLPISPVIFVAVSFTYLVIFTVRACILTIIISSYCIDPFVIM
jgi:hypothetical protein